MVKVGFTIWYGDHRYLGDRIKRVHEAGFDYIELSLDYPWPYVDTEKFINTISKLVKSYGLQIAIHGPWRDIRLASPINEIREASLKVYRKILKISSRLDPLYFNFHIISEEAIRFNSVKRAVLYAAAKSLENVLSEVESLGIDVTVENNIDGIMSEPEHYINLRNIMGKDFCVCFDVGHALMPYLRRSDESPYSILDYWIACLSDFRTLTVHLNDIEKVGNCIHEHLIFGQGILDFNQVLNKVKYIRGLDYALLEIFWSRTKNGERKTIQPEELRELIDLIRKRL